MTTLDRYSSTIALLIVVGTFAAAALIAAVGRVPEAVLQPTPALAYITVFATPQPTQAPPTPDREVQQELAQLRARVAELEAERRVSPIGDAGAIPESQPVNQVQAAPTQPPPPPPTAQPGPELQAITIPEGEEISPALFREMQDQ